MAIRISGKNLDIGDALRGKIDDRVSGLLTKYFDHSYHGHVTLTKDGNAFRAECVLHLDTGVTLEASSRAYDASTCFDLAADKIESRLRRYKQRIRNKHGSAKKEIVADMPTYVFEVPTDDVEKTETFHPIVIAETTKSLHEFAVSDAVMELDMTGKPLLLFKHAGSGRLNVVYRRTDGTIGWIDPQAA
jgi:ribosomal subunit interface protein